MKTLLFIVGLVAILVGSAEAYKHSPWGPCPAWPYCATEPADPYLFDGGAYLDANKHAAMGHDVMYTNVTSGWALRD